MVESMFDGVQDMSQLPVEAFSPLVYRRGDVVDGEIVSIDSEGLTVSIGLKSEGVVPQHQMRTLSAEERSNMALGDKITVTVTRGGEMVELSLDQARQEQMWESLRIHLASSDIVEAAVTGFNRGGLEVEVNGIKGFVPVSHVAPVSPRSNERDLECRVGSQSVFNVLEMDPVQERLILSERAIWLSQREKAKQIFIESLEEGSLVTGIVKSIRGFGAFLDIGDADGLIPISELSWHMLKSPEEVVELGDELTVQVLQVDHEKQRISLSLKRTLPEPWESVPERYSEGDIVEGTVIKLADFGVFVRLEHWVEGLIHISELSPRKLTNPSEIVYQGQKVSVKILSIDMSKRRMSLSYKQAYGM